LAGISPVAVIVSGCQNIRKNQIKTLNNYQDFNIVYPAA
jgi:hypothetical protein